MVTNETSWCYSKGLKLELHTTLAGGRCSSLAAICFPTIVEITMDYFFSINAKNISMVTTKYIRIDVGQPHTASFAFLIQ